MSGLDRSIRFTKVAGFEVTEVPDGYVIYDDPKGEVHYLNPTAALIYEFSDGNRTVSDIAEFIRDAYDLDEEPVLHDVFASLEDKGLVCRAT